MCYKTWDLTTLFYVLQSSKSILFVSYNNSIWNDITVYNRCFSVKRMNALQLVLNGIFHCTPAQPAPAEDCNIHSLAWPQVWSTVLHNTSSPELQYSTSEQKKGFLTCSQHLNLQNIGIPILHIFVLILFNDSATNNLRCVRKEY